LIVFFVPALNVKVSVLLYHGPQKERMNLVKKIRQHQGPLRMCPVVVTSFEIAMRDRKSLQVNRSGIAYLVLSYKKLIFNLIINIFIKT
jgi:hypothetical protein